MPAKPLNDLQLELADLRAQFRQIPMHTAEYARLIYQIHRVSQQIKQELKAIADL